MMAQGVVLITFVDVDKKMLQIFRKHLTLR